MIDNREQQYNSVGTDCYCNKRSWLYENILKRFAYISRVVRNIDEASCFLINFQEFDVILIVVVKTKMFNSLRIVL